MMTDSFARYKKWLIPTGIGFGFLWLIAMIALLYEGRNQPPVSQAQIPPETKEFLQWLGKQIPDLQFLKRAGSSKDWTNRHDDEEAARKGFQRIASENFIVYFRTGDRARADQILQYAEESKYRLLEVFNHFPYAERKNGRRLPIYLATSQNEYEELSRIEIPSAGCLRTELYDDGWIATAYISPVAFSEGEEYARQVVTHEVAHYAHFDLADIENLHNFRVWFTEGAASFAAKEYYRLNEIRARYKANELLPLPVLNSFDNHRAYRSASLSLFYATGYSVLQMVEQTFGRKKVTDLIFTASKKTDIGGASQRILGLNLEQLNQMWFEYLQMTI